MQYLSLYLSNIDTAYICFTRKYLIDGLDPPKALYIFKKQKNKKHIELRIKILHAD